MLCAFSINFLILLLLLFSLLSSLSSSNHFIPFHGIFFYFCLPASFAFQAEMCYFPSALRLVIQNKTLYVGLEKRCV